MGYREAIKRGMGYKESELEDCCVNILTETDEYPDRSYAKRKNMLYSLQAQCFRAPDHWFIRKEPRRAA